MAGFKSQLVQFQDYIQPVRAMVGFVSAKTRVWGLPKLGGQGNPEA